MIGPYLYLYFEYQYTHIGTNASLVLLERICWFKQHQVQSLQKNPSLIMPNYCSYLLHLVLKVSQVFAK
jgi:hypothetical protein